MIQDINFADYLYYPTLRTRAAELKGLQMLDAERKRRIIPLLTLGRWPKALDFARSAEKAVEAVEGNPLFLDLTPDGRNLADQHQYLRDASNGYENWRNFAAGYTNAIPVMQLGADARLRDVTRQARLVEGAVGRLAFRIRDFATETPLVIAALSALDQPANAIVFIDSQYVRSAISAYITATIATTNQLRQEFPELVISMLATSFPSSTVSFADASGQRGAIDVLEREMHSRIGGSNILAYGDHGSVHSVVYDDAPIMRWAARVDYPRELDWYFERRPGNQTAEGYVSAAQAIAGMDSNIGTRGIWGEQMILDAAAGSPHGKAPAAWISVRVNIHLSRQIDFSERLTTGGDDDLEEQDAL